MPTRPTTTMGEAFRAMRAARGLKQKEVAERAGLDPSYISLVEAGRREPSIDAIGAVARALDVPPFALHVAAADLVALRRLSPAAARLAVHLRDEIFAAMFRPPAPCRRKSR